MRPIFRSSTSLDLMCLAVIARSGASRSAIRCAFALSLGALLWFGSRSGAAQNNQDVRALELDKPYERELAGGQSHAYRIALAAGQFLHVVVEQKGIDVVVTLLGPDGRKIIEVNSRDGVQGQETVLLAAEAGGSYRLETRSLDKTTALGRYEIKIVELRNATPEDHKRIAGEQTMARAKQLSDQETGESLRDAIKEYEKARLQFQELGDRAGEATALDKIGMIYHLLRQPRKALEHYLQAASLRQALGDRNSEAETLTKIGSAYSDLREFDKALDHLHQALEVKREFKDLPEQASNISNIGDVYQAKGEPEKALEYYEQALPLWRQTGDRKNEAKTRGNMAIVYRRIGDNQKARDYFTQSLNLSREAKDRHSEHVTMAYLGGIFTWLGDMRQALEHYGSAIAYFRDLGDRRTEASLLDAMSTVHLEAGAWQKTLDNLNQALMIARESGARQLEARVLHNLGHAYHAMNEHQQSFDHYQQALRIRHEIKDRDGEAETLGNLGELYRSLGEYEKALSYILQALPLFQAGKYRRGEANSLHNLGLVYRNLRNYQEAIKQFELALRIWSEISDRAGEGLTLRNIGFIYLNDLGDTTKALECYEKSLALAREVNDRNGEADALTKLGTAYQALRELEKAIESLDKSLKLHREVKDRRREAEALFWLGRVERDRGNFDQARDHLEDAIEISESLRVNIVSRELRASFISTVYSIYAHYIDVLMRLHQQRPSAGFAESALQTSERTRARSLLESLNESRVDIRRGVPLELLAEEERLSQQLDAKAHALLRSGRNTRAAGQTDALQRDYEMIDAELQQLRAQIKQKSPGYASLTQIQPTDVSEIKKSLDADTLLLEYSLGEERSFLWAVSTDSIESYELPKRAAIKDATEKLLAVLSTPRGRRTGETLAQVLELLPPVSCP